MKPVEIPGAEPVVRPAPKRPRRATAGQRKVRASPQAGKRAAKKEAVKMVTPDPEEEREVSRTASG